MSYVEEFKFYCQKVIPLVYDDALSYYETLCKVSQKLNEVINTVNTFGSDFTTYTDNKVAQLDVKLTGKMSTLQTSVNEQLNAMQASVDTSLQNVTTQLNSTKSYVDSSIATQQVWLLNEISKTNQEVTKQINLLRNYIDANDSGIYIYVDEEIQKVIDLIPEITSVMVNNPITGKLDNIQNVLNYLTNYFKYYAYDAQSYDNEGFTANEFEAFNIKALEFDLYGWKVIHVDERFTMRSPITGLETNYKNVIAWLVTQHITNAITALAYDEEEITATNFELLQLTAYQYDFNGIYIP